MCNVIYLSLNLAPCEYTELKIGTKINPIINLRIHRFFNHTIAHVQNKAYHPEN